MVLLQAHSKAEIYAALNVEKRVIRCRVTPTSLSWVTYVNENGEIVYFAYDPDEAEGE